MQIRTQIDSHMNTQEFLNILKVLFLLNYTIFYKDIFN